MAVRTRQKQTQKQKQANRRIALVLLFLLLLVVGWFVYQMLSENKKQTPPNTLENNQQQPQTQPQQEPPKQEQEKPVQPLAGTRNDWNLILVSKKSPLPSNFQVNLAYIRDGYRGDARVKAYVNTMIDDAQKQGITLTLCSAYRTKETSASLYKSEVQAFVNRGYSQKEAEKEAARWVAPPGTSEHHTGLAFDIVTPSYQTLDHGFKNTQAAKWLKANCAKYGFILRFPEDKQNVTGITFEPWHFRYVGKTHAQKIMSEGLCLEEYLEKYYQ